MIEFSAGNLGVAQSPWILHNSEVFFILMYSGSFFLRNILETIQFSQDDSSEQWKNKNVYWSAHRTKGLSGLQGSLSVCLSFCFFLCLKTSFGRKQTSLKNRFGADTEGIVLIP